MIAPRLVNAAREAGDLAMMAVRLGHDLPRFLRHPLSVDGACRRLAYQLAQREPRFLDLVDRAIYGHEQSPYRWLLGVAGCERGDLHALTAREGIEGALRELAARGVYVTFDEMKGRRPIVRGSARRSFADRDFDNPLVAGHYVLFTSGSGGRPTRVRRPLSPVLDAATLLHLSFEARGIRDPGNVLWLGAPISWALVHLKMGQRIDSWLYPIEPLPSPARAVGQYLRALSAMAGRRMPPPEHCDLLQPDVLVQWLGEHASEITPVVVNTVASSAVRVAVLATSAGVSLRGVAFHCRSEPLSAARRRLIERTGALVITDYGSIELPHMAFGCAAGVAADDAHLSVNVYAAIERQRQVIEGGPLVDALLMTTLQPYAPKVAINAELGDTAEVVERDCGCLLGSLGMRTHLSNIRSFEKLSSEGTTFARSNLLQILEEVLPARFGGTALDYQLVEEEADGSTVLVLRAHPDVGPLDEDAVRGVLLDEMRRGGLVGEYQARLLERAASIVVRRLPPIATRAGKVLPFHLARTTVAEASRSRPADR